MENMMNGSVLISIIGLLVVLTNLVVQVIKRLTQDKISTNILVVVVSMALTLGTFFSYCHANTIGVAWHMVFAAVVLAFMVAYAAMFGYDKLMEAIGQINKL